MTSTFHRIQVYLSPVAGPTLREMTCQRMISRHLFFITHFSIYINLFTIYHTKILSLNIYYFVSNWPLVKNLCQEKKKSLSEPILFLKILLHILLKMIAHYQVPQRLIMHFLIFINSSGKYKQNLQSTQKCSHDKRNRRLILCNRLH